MRAGVSTKKGTSGSHPHTLFWECPSMRWKRGEGRTSSVDKGTLLPAKDVRAGHPAVQDSYCFLAKKQYGP